MQNIIDIVIYVITRISALAFSLEVADGISIGALLVAAALLSVIFRALVGIHLNVFNSGSAAIDRHRRSVRRRNAGSGNKD